MCGIIGYTGEANAIPKIQKGLSVLEYRGYDSVGLAAQTASGVKTVKCSGRVEALREKLKEANLCGAPTAIGHTRWATHGGPTDRNAHPHTVLRVTLVHNGIIENHRILKAECEQQGIVFHSETDTEIATAVIALAYEATGCPITAIRTATKKMQGAYAFAMMFEDIEHEIYAVRMGSPLLVAKGEDGCYLASDITALLPFTNCYSILKEGEIARFGNGMVTLYGAAGEYAPEWSVTQMTAEAAQKGGYRHFMLKETMEEPEAIRKGLSMRIADGMPNFSEDGIPETLFRDVEAIHIVACGSAMHAGLLGARFFETFAKLPASVYIASEYRYHPPVSAAGTLVILISQSGETADTLAALRDAKSRGHKTLAIVNAVETTIAREADYRIYTYAGPEIAVATTKGYCTQLSMLYHIALAVAHFRGEMTESEVKREVESLFYAVPRAMEKILKKRELFRNIAERIVTADHIFYIGRGTDYALSEEGALKLKEISYIHAEAYAAGELKHGTISLIEEGTPVVAISTDQRLYEKTESNVREVRSRGAYVILLCREDAPSPENAADIVVSLPSASFAETLFSTLAVLQMIAYETALLKGCDIDKPRNLAKSVTVE